MRYLIMAVASVRAGPVLAGPLFTLALCYNIIRAVVFRDLRSVYS